MAKMIVRVITMRTLSLLSLEAVLPSVVSRDDPPFGRGAEAANIDFVRHRKTFRLVAYLLPRD